MTKELEKYLYDEDVGIIYELDEYEIYNPIIFVNAEEKECSDSIEAKSRLEYLKEQRLEMYIELCKEDGLKEYIDIYLSELIENKNIVMSKMDGKSAMDKLVAQEISRDITG